MENRWFDKINAFIHTSDSKFYPLLIHQLQIFAIHSNICAQSIITFHDYCPNWTCYSQMVKSHCFYPLPVPIHHTYVSQMLQFCYGYMITIHFVLTTYTVLCIPKYSIKVCEIQWTAKVILQEYLLFCNTYT